MESHILDELVGKWHQVEVENYDAFLKALGLNFLLRKAGVYIKTHEEWEKDEDLLTFKLINTFKTETAVFKLEEEFKQVTIDGRKVKSKYTLADNSKRLIHTEFCSPYNCTYTREMHGEQLKLYLTVEKPTPVTAIKTFKRMIED